MRLSVLFILFAALAACDSQPVPEPLKIGNKVEFALLQDQYANPFPHEDKMEILLYADDMETSRDVRDAIGRVESACYEQGQLVFVANVSGMPTLITRMIALPKMRGYGFPIWLDYDGEATEALPLQEDHISIVRVKNGAIISVEFVQGMESVMNVIVPLCGLRSEQVAQL